jgi:hypothetical protein
LDPKAVRCRRSVDSGPRTIVSLAAAVALVAGVAAPAGSAPVAADDPAATLVAHETRDGVVIDRMAGGAPALVESEAAWPWSHEPSFVLRERGAAAAGLWRASADTLVVRAGTDDGAPLAGRVEPSWEDGAIRLTIALANGPSLHTGVFTRRSNGAGPSEITRLAGDSLDLDGRYEAPLLAADGTRVGWLRVALLRRSPRPTFEAALPPSVDERLAAATVQALDAEIGWIDTHVRGVTRAPESR